MLRFLGKQLVLAGMDQLPDGATELAEKFRETIACNEADRFKLRWRIMIDLCVLIDEIMIRQNKADEKEEEDNPYAWIDNITCDYDYRGVLPKAFGKFGQSDARPVCLGMAMLLTSWARLANAEVLLVHPLGSITSMEWKFEGKLSKMMCREIRQRRLVVRDGLMDGLRENILKAKAHREYTTDFHAAVAVRLNQEVWMYVDPYFGRCAVLSSILWGQNWISESLHDLDQARPGMVVTGNDRGFLKDWFDQQEKQVVLAFEASYRLEKLLPDLSQKEKFLDQLWQTRESKVLLRLARGCFGTSRPKHAIIKAMFGWKQSERIKREQLDDAWGRFEKSSQFRRRCVKRLLGLFLVWSKKRYYVEKQRSEYSGEFSSACMEMSCPEFMIALLVLNNLNCWAVKKDQLGIMPLKHSTSQILWHEVMATIDPSFDAGPLGWILEDSTKYITSLRPHLHRRCESRLRMIQKGGEKRND